MPITKNKMTEIEEKQCSRCPVMLPDGWEYINCEECREYFAAIRQIKRENKIQCNAKKQDGTRCNFKVSKECGGMFCEKHIVEWKEYQQTGGKEVRRCNSRRSCDPDNPGIKAILPKGYTKKKCESCLIREREKDKALRHNKKKANSKIQKLGLHICTECPMNKKYKIEEMGLKKNGTRSHLCKHHFEMLKKSEKNRPDRNRIEEYREYDNKPERKYKNYLKNARIRKINFDIDFKIFKKLIMDDCYYCGLKRGKKLNGIDRIDNNKHYTFDNIVTACGFCNKMKNTLNEATFILMCAHIAHFNKMLKLKSYSQFFNNYTTRNKYLQYKQGAVNRNFCFNLTKEDFSKLINGSCYICGRPTTNKHCNGIDRYDNNKGYELDNCKTCCGDCNFLKKTLDHDDFLFQCAFIAYNHRNRLEELEKKWKPSRFRVLSEERLNERKFEKNKIDLVNKCDIVEI